MRNIEHLQNPKLPPGGPKIADVVWKWCTEFLTSHTKPCLVCSKLIPRLLLPAPNSHRWGQPFMNFCEHVQDVFVKFVVKLSIVSEVLFAIIKLPEMLSRS